MQKETRELRQDIADFMPLKKMLTPKDVARYLSCSERTVRRACVCREIKAVKMGKLWRISRYALQEYIELQERKF